MTTGEHLGRPDDDRAFAHIDFDRRTAIEQRIKAAADDDTFSRWQIALEASAEELVDLKSGIALFKSE